MESTKNSGADHISNISCCNNIHSVPISETQIYHSISVLLRKGYWIHDLNCTPEERSHQHYIYLKEGGDTIWLTQESQDYACHPILMINNVPFIL